MKYNTKRPLLVITEYGRNIQQMVEEAVMIEDRETRNLAAKTIINLMATVSPGGKEEEDFYHKLWDHLHIMAKFELDVDSPYPKPDEEILQFKPNKPAYPRRKMRFAHYGNIIESFIRFASSLEPGEEKDRYTEIIANMMKKAYLNHNRDSVNDEMIKDQLKDLSRGELQFKEGHKLSSTNEILHKQKQQVGHQQNNNSTNRFNKNKNKNNKFKKKKY